MKRNERKMKGNERKMKGNERKMKRKVKKSCSNYRGSSVAVLPRGVYCPLVEYSERTLVLGPMRSKASCSLCFPWLNFSFHHNWYLLRVKKVVISFRRFRSVFRRFRTFSGLFGHVFTHSDTFGYIRMLSAKIFRQAKFLKFEIFGSKTSRRSLMLSHAFSTFA